MAQTPNYYSDGLVSLDLGASPANLRTIMGHGTTWLNKIYGGDILMVIGVDESTPPQPIATMVPIERVTESEQLILAIDWPSAPFTEQPYIILYTAPQRYDYLTLAQGIAYTEEHLNLFNKARPIFSVKTFGLDAPTGAEGTGDLVVVSASPDPFSVFANQPHAIAEKTEHGHLFHTPEHGWFHVSEDDHVARFFNGSAWVVSGALLNAPIYIPGGWQAADTYSLGHVVTHLGSSWIAKRETVGDEPNLSPADWESYTGLGEHGGAITLRYKFSADTAVDAADAPGALNLNAAPDAATGMGLSATDAFGNDRTALLQSLLTISDSAMLGQVRLVAVGEAGSKDFSARITAGDAVASPPTRFEFAIDEPIPLGVFADQQDILFMFTPAGAHGTTGEVGPEGLAGAPTGTPLLFDAASTDDSDPGGPGRFRFNTDTQNTATVVRVDDLNTEGVSIDSFLDAMEALTTSATRFIAMFVHREQPALKYIAFAVSDVVGAVGYRNLHGVVIGYSAPNPFVDADEVMMQLFVAGSQGSAASIEVGLVNPLPHTEPPTVVNTGTPQEAVFDFGIPAGAPFEPDYVVNTIAQRDAYADEPVGTAVLVAADSTNGGKATLYFLQVPSASSPAAASWSAPIDFVPVSPIASAGEEVESTIAASATTDIGALPTTRVLVSGGAGPVNSFGPQINRYRIVRFADANLVLTNSAGLVLLGGANRTTAVNDVGHYASDAVGIWRETYWSRATTAGPGLAQRATTAIAQAGVDDTRFITSVALKTASRALTYGPEAAAIFEQASAAGLTYSRMHVIADTISKLKYAGYWDKFDLLYFLQAYDATTALINWKEPGTFNLTAVNSPAFTKDGGFTGNNTSAYLASGYTPNGDRNMQQDNASAAVKIASYPTPGKALFGSAAGTLRINLNPAFGGTQFLTRFNDITNTSNPSAVATGLFSADRSTASQYLKFIDGVLNGTVVVASVGYTGAITLLATPVGAQFSDARMTFAWVGASIGTAAAHAAVNTIHSQYATAIGAT
jgi:hypothetical protein